MKPVALVLAFLWAMPIHAQIQPLTEDRLREAASPNGRVPINDPFYTRMNRSGSDTLAALEVAKKGPFAISIETPYSRVYFAASEARRKYADPPMFRLDEVNGLGIIVTVGPGENFLSAGTIEALVLKRGDAITRPVASRLTPTTIKNALGATRESAVGRFQFPLEVFAPEGGSLILVCVGKQGNFEWTITGDDLYAMR